jgi:hypothetical protein
MKAYDFKTSNYFPWHIKLVGGGLAIVGLYALLSAVFIGGIIVLSISVLVLTTHYRCRVDFDKKEYHDYLWILGMKNGEKKKFDTIEYIFIKKSNVSQKMGLRAATTTIQKSVYDGYLKFSDTEKMHIVTKDSKENLISKLRHISTNLKVDILDFSDGDPKII